MKNVTAGNFRRLPDDKYKECESIPHLKLLDKPSKKEQRRKEIKNICFVVSLVWIISLTFMMQVIVENRASADICSAFLIVTAVLHVAGCR